jgi:nitrogenase molybdenum-iron protein alpha/beta subunit
VSAAGAGPLAPPLAEAFSSPYRHPYLIGLFLAVNAIPDVYGVIDGPDCNYRKAEWVFGSHDLRSTLLDALGQHRVVPTLVNAEGVIKSVGDEVVKRIRRVSLLPDVGLCMVCSMPHVTIIGTQYGRLLEGLRDQVPFPLIEVPSRSLDGDWLDGYADTLTAIAQSIDVRGADPSPRRVAVIGHLMDRTEYDQLANVSEIERMLGAVGLDPVSIWLSGRPYAHLVAARDAGLLLAFPHGVAAARALARRTGARVIEVPVPFGLGPTQRLLRAVAAALDPGGASGDGGLTGEVERFIDAELGRLVPRLEWVIPRVFLGRQVAFSGDPALFGSIVQLCEELGMEVVHLSSSVRRPGWLGEPEPGGQILPPMTFAGPSATLARELGALIDEGAIDLVIADSHLALLTPQTQRVAFLEHGFPSERRHALSERPFLGFRGWISFVDELAAVVMAAMASRGR